MKQIENKLETWELDNGIVLRNVHSRKSCGGDNCVFHNPSDHHMKDWPLHYRDDRGIFERICEHNVGHPDPDQFDYWDRTGQDWQGVHGCDGCCHIITSSND